MYICRLKLFIHFFIKVQGKDPSVDITQDIVEESEDERFDDVSDTNPWVELPPCEIGKLEDINEVSLFCYLYVFVCILKK